MYRFKLLLPKQTTNILCKTELPDQHTINMQWTVSNTFNLIAAIREKDVLWNVDSEAYKDRNHREHAWDAVADKLQMSKTEVGDKWRLMRQQFRVRIFAFVYNL